MTDPYADFRDADGESLGENAMARLAGLAKSQVDAEARIAQLEAELQEAKANLNHIKEHQLPELMDELELTEFTTRDGTKIKVAEAIRGSIPKATEAEAFDWLENNGQGRLIKRQFIIEFGKDDDKWADKFERDCKQRKKPLNLKRKKAVHPQSLQAFVREQLEEGVDFPMKTFGVYRQRFAKVDVAK